MVHEGSSHEHVICQVSLNPTSKWTDPRVVKCWVPLEFLVLYDVR